jgi:hypothetical protein
MIRDLKGSNYLGDWLAHPERDDYWQADGRSLAQHLDRIRVPSLYIEGLYDIFAQNGLETYRRIQTVGGRSLLVLGPWQHMPWQHTVGDLDFGPDATPRLDLLQMAWFDHVLKADGRRDAPLLPEDRARVFVMGTNRWLSLKDWPASDKGVVHYLHSAGAANTVWGDGRLGGDPPGTEAADILVHDPLSPAQVAGGQSCCNDIVTPMGPRVQTVVEEQQAVLVYSGETVHTATRLVGTPEVRLYVSSEAEELFIHARLCWVHRDGRSYNLTEAAVRVHFLGEDAAGEGVMTADLTLGPVAIELSSGESVRLHVALSAFPTYQVHTTRSGNQSAIPPTKAHIEPMAVLHDAAHPSYLKLPVCTVAEGGDGGAPPWRDWVPNVR